MRPISILSLIALFFTAPAFAQFSVQESFNDSGYTYSFFSLAATEADQTEVGTGQDGTGRLTTYNYLTVGKKLNYDLSGGVRIPFMYNTAGRDRFNEGEVQESELLLHDIILFLRNSNLALLPLDVGVYWEGRIYLPTSEHSRTAKTIGSYRNHFIFNKVLSRKFDLEYDQKVTYFHQSQTAYANRFLDDRGEEVAVASLTKAWELEHRMNVWYKIDGETGLGIQVGYEDSYYNKSKENSRSFDRSTYLTKPAIHKAKLGPAARFALNSKINFILTYSDVVVADENINEWGQFRAENAEIALLSFVRF